MSDLYKSVFFFFLLYAFHLNAEENVLTKQPSLGYYQTLNLDSETPCNCDIKTIRNEELNARLLESDVSKYDLHAYTFKFGTSMLPASKLFHAFEADSNVYKISFSLETNTFMILTTHNFDIVSFETAAKIAFQELAAINPQDFLYKKSKSCYDAYLQFLAKSNNGVK